MNKDVILSRNLEDGTTRINLAANARILLVLEDEREIDASEVFKYVIKMMDKENASSIRYNVDFSKGDIMKLVNYRPEDMGGDCPRCGRYNERYIGEKFNGTDECWNCHQSLDDMSVENDEWEIEQDYLENLKREQREAEAYQQMFMEAHEKGEL